MMFKMSCTTKAVIFRYTVVTLESIKIDGVKFFL